MNGGFRIGRIGIVLGATLVASGGAAAAASALVSPGATAALVARPARILGIRACATREMRISVQPLGGSGHVAWLLRFTSHAPAECALSGYPRVQAISAYGRHVTVRRTRRGYLGGLTYGGELPLVALEPGHVASAIIEGLTASASGGDDCPTYRALRVTPPNVTGAVTLRSSLTVCAPQVHPILAGSTGRTPPPPVT